MGSLRRNLTFDQLHSHKKSKYKFLFTFQPRQHTYIYIYIYTYTQIYIAQKIVRTNLSCQHDTARICYVVAAERRRPQLSIDVLPTGRSAANPPHAATTVEVERWDRRTGHMDRQTTGRQRPLHRPCSALYAGSVNKTDKSEAAV